MKKYMRTFVLLLFTVLILLSLAGCQTEQPYRPESASALWHRVDEAMAALDSYEMTQELRVVTYHMGYEYVTERTVASAFGSEFMYNETETVVSCEAISLLQTTNTVEAFCDGKMYVANHDGLYDQKFCSPMTLEEYLGDMTDDLMERVDVEDCTSALFAQNEDSTWSLEFSGYTKKTIDQVLKSMELTEASLGGAVDDMKMSLTADGAFRVQEMTISFVFSVTEEEAEISPEFTVTTRYSGFHEVNFDPAKLNTEEFREVADVRLPAIVSEQLKARQEALSGAFTLALETTYVLQGQTSVSRETDSVTYGKKNGAYYYSIAATMDGSSFAIQYQNGQQLVDSDGQSHTAAQTDEEAKLFIDGLIDSGKYNSLAVTDIQKLEDGVYVLSCEYLDVSQFAGNLGGAGTEIAAAVQQITITFQAGKLIRIDSQITLNGTYSGEPMSMEVASSVAFTD